MGRQKHQVRDLQHQHVACCMFQRVAKQTFDKLQLRFVNRCLRFTKASWPEARGRKKRRRTESTEEMNREKSRQDRVHLQKTNQHFHQTFTEAKEPTGEKESRTSQEQLEHGRLHLEAKQNGMQSVARCYSSRGEQVKPFWAVGVNKRVHRTFFSLKLFFL